MAEPVLDRAGVNAVIGELVAEECRSMWNWNGMRGRQHAKLIAADGMDGWLARGRRLASLTGEERFQVRFCREESNREAR